MKEDTYIPYGPEWEKEMMKLPKKILIQFFKEAKIRLHLAEQIIETSVKNSSITPEQTKEFADWIASKLQSNRQR